MNGATQTIEGWYALHDFRKINWNAWKAANSHQHVQSEKELTDYYTHWNQMEQLNQGSSTAYHILGHKADIVFIHLRETLEQLNECKTLLDKSVLGSYLTPTHSYVSVVELSNYFTKPGLDYTQDLEIMSRLKPIMPKAKHMCFYPMDKRRTEADNWYMLSTDERKAFMRSHGLIGRTYAGKVKQIITGSVGFDNWEWGVTLFADDALHIKKLIYEMRFDEASARFAEFGDFYLGNVLPLDSFVELIRLQQVYPEPM